MDVFSIYCQGDRAIWDESGRRASEPTHGRLELKQLLVDQDIGFPADFGVKQRGELLDGRLFDQAVRPGRLQAYYSTGRIRERFEIECDDPGCRHRLVSRAEKLNPIIMKLHRHGRTEAALQELEGILALPPRAGA